MPALLGLSGSLRSSSVNTALLKEAARLYEPDTFEMGDIRFPLYDGDDEAATGIPDAVQTLSDQIAAAEAVIISTPEYNKGPSGALKNALDWVSRTEGNPWAGKPVAVMSATAGRAGGERAQMVLRGFMVPFRPRILQGPEIHLAGAAGEFNEAGQLTSDRYVQELTTLMSALKSEAHRS